MVCHTQAFTFTFTFTAGCVLQGAGASQGWLLFLWEDDYMLCLCSQALTSPPPFLQEAGCTPSYRNPTATTRVGLIPEPPQLGAKLLVKQRAPRLLCWQGVQIKCVVLKPAGMSVQQQRRQQSCYSKCVRVTTGSWPTVPWAFSLDLRSRLLFFAFC